LDDISGIAAGAARIFIGEGRLPVAVDAARRAAFPARAEP
jgi:hypothetical protein